MERLTFVTLTHFHKLTGYSPAAVRGKIRRLEWLEGIHYQKAPDGRLLIHLGEYEKWVKGETCVQRQKAASK